jgi:glutamine amidotransferase
MIAIVDYGVGNLYSLQSSFASIGQPAAVTNNAANLAKAERIILPGVGAFGDAAALLRKSGLWDAVIAQSKIKPLLGICLGMQLLFEKSLEFGEHEGLGLIPGTVRPISDVVPTDYKIPHMGWNALEFPPEKSPLFKYTQDSAHVYFVHSFHAVAAKTCITATCDYGAPLTAAAASGNVYGVQFHPEKSGDVGLGILKAFCEIEV